MKMNAGTWIGIVGAIIGFVVAIAAIIATMGSMAPWLAIFFSAIFALIFFVFFKFFFGPLMNARRLMATGLPGKAIVKDVRDTGVTINDNPQVKLLLEVKNNFGQKYEATVRTLVSRINPQVYHIGMELPVKIDPKNEKNVVIDTTAATASAFTKQATTALSESTLKTELEQLQQTIDAVSLSGRPARAIVKKYTWLGANVNGQNPYVELEVEVLPEHSMPFTAKVKGVIAEASVPKFQPGSDIFVKYDFYDNSRVVIDHSA